MTDLVLAIVGLTTLLCGGELLLRGAIKVAQAFGMSRLLIGLTIVSMGTSAPEMAICLGAAFKGSPEIALGNIVGSNIANILLILGITAIVIPIAVQRSVIRREIPVMIGVAVAFGLLVIDGALSRFDGLLLLSGAIAFCVWQFRTATEDDCSIDQADLPESTNLPDVPTPGTQSILLSNIFILFGIAMLWVGSGWLVTGATGLAKTIGVSDLVIGLTVVAIGSSAPEIVTSLMAARKGYPEMAIGNVIGSNIANLMLVGGATGAVSSGISVPLESLEFDIPVMVIASIACMPVFISGYKISRREGVVFFGCFVAFTSILFFKDCLTSIFPHWRRMIWLIAIPICVATVISLIRHARTDSRKTSGN